ncbi:MAG: hypothetical protein KatS3mg087_1721 [Patescibacteria group bacterium]|nr:MAG: hypothetical protein KatS3mg087_1721 [Patescibacteria group bacterium]
MQANTKSNGWLEFKNLPRGILSQTQQEDLEKIVLGCLLDDQSFLDTLSVEDFSFEINKAIFRSIQFLSSMGIPINEAEIFGQLKTKNNLENNLNFSTIASLREYTVYRSGIDYYIDRLKLLSAYRRRAELYYKLSEAYSRADGQAILQLEKKLFEEVEILNDSSCKLISLANHEPIPQSWLLQNAIPEGFPTILYGDSGLGKSYLAVYLGILACLGGERFFDLSFPDEPSNTLYLDWELDVNEFARRAKRIATGLNLAKIPGNFFYLSPRKSLFHILPTLKGVIKGRNIGFLIIDSFGAGYSDADNVSNIIELFARIKDLGVTTLILDHQSKPQAGDSYELKRPFGSSYKYNLARSVFQLSCISREKNQISLMLRHKKSNFGGTLEDLVFDIVFEGDRVMFYESKTPTPEERDMELIHEAMTELEKKGEKINRKNLINHLKGILGRDKLTSLLEKGTGLFWDSTKGEKKEILYKPKNLKAEYIYNPSFRLLRNSEEIEFPEVLNDD